jgi:hypothetical protein
VDGIEPSSLWFEVEGGFESFLDLESFDAPAVALLYPALEAGRDLEITGSVSGRLLWSLNHLVSPLLNHIVPSVGIAQVKAGGTTDLDPAGEFVATGFSCGIDSFAVYADHIASPDVPGAMRVTHLLFNDVGSHDGGRHAATMRSDRWKAASGAAADIGLPIIATRSNLDQFYRASFEQTHTLRNAAVALLLQRGICRWLYASAYRYRDIRIAPSAAIAVSDPVLIPMLSTGSIDLVSVGAQYSRVEKTAMIHELPIVQERLNVCTRTARNCSRCQKCLRTLITLEVLGSLTEFSSVFDLKTYARYRPGYLSALRQSQGLLEREIREAMQSAGFHVSSNELRIPLGVTLREKVAVVKRSAWKVVRKWRAGERA